MTENLPGMSIPEFYAGKNVFITGGTGFMGKVLIEKLLRSIPDVGSIYILIRPKRNKTIEDRKKDLLSSMLFDSLRADHPERLEKIIVVGGEVTQPNVGLSDEDLQTIIENVSIVFHVAASIRFDALLHDAYQMNVKGLVEIIKIAKMIKNLVSMVHVSTAYANCNRSVIDEVVYPPKIQPEKLEAALEWMSEEQADVLTPSLLDDLPNTYTYTKGLAEYILMKEAGDLPISIFRPSIVGAAVKEPAVGWVDCLHGLTGLLIAVGKGVLRILRCHPEGIADIVPVDYVDNMLIAIGWMTGMQRKAKPLIYHCTSGTINPCTWRQMHTIVMPYFKENPYQEIVRRPSCVECKPRRFYPYYTVFYHIIPALFLDLSLWISGKKPRMVMICRKLDKALACLDYFTVRTWTWSNHNSERLWQVMSEEDKETFFFDISSINWKTYYEGYVDGARQFMLKEDPAKIPENKVRYRRLRNIRYTFNLLMFLIATRLIYLKFETARIIWSKLASICLRLLASLGLKLPEMLTSLGLNIPQMLVA
jgi:fatty acyl-CoA reductase